MYRDNRSYLSSLGHDKSDMLFFPSSYACTHLLVPFLVRYDSPSKSITILSTVSSPNAKSFSDGIRDDVQSKFDTVFDESRGGRDTKRIHDDERVSAAGCMARVIRIVKSKNRIDEVIGS